jgi:hypothetical protein
MVNVYELQAQAVELGVLNQDLTSPVSHNKAREDKINHDIFKAAMVENVIKKTLEKCGDKKEA